MAAELLANIWQTVQFRGEYRKKNVHTSSDTWFFITLNDYSLFQTGTTVLLISNTGKGIMQKWDMQELHMPIIHPNHLPLIPVLVCIIQVCIVYTDKAFSTLPTANLKCSFPYESATWIHISKRKTSRGWLEIRRKDVQVWNTEVDCDSVVKNMNLQQQNH